MFSVAQALLAGLSIASLLLVTLPAEVVGPNVGWVEKSLSRKVQYDQPILLMVQKSQTTTWDVWNLINNVMNYQPQLKLVQDLSGFPAINPTPSVLKSRGTAGLKCSALALSWRSAADPGRGVRNLSKVSRQRIHIVPCCIHMLFIYYVICCI